MFLFGSPGLTHTLCNSRPSMAEKAKLTPQTGEGKKTPNLFWFVSGPQPDGLWSIRSPLFLVRDNIWTAKYSSVFKNNNNKIGQLQLMS